MSVIFTMLLQLLHKHIIICVRYSISYLFIVYVTCKSISAGVIYVLINRMCYLSHFNKYMYINSKSRDNCVHPKYTLLCAVYSMKKMNTLCVIIAIIHINELS